MASERPTPAFAGRYRFFRDISHAVLPTLPAMDVALVDGDHNWHTVFHELRMLAETARASLAPLPVLILHDVGWPYGRRDLYYAPERIPEEVSPALPSSRHAARQ